MGLGDLWNNALVYFGIAEEEEWDDEAYVTHEDMERTYAERPNVRRLTPRRGRHQQAYEDWTDEEPVVERSTRQSRRVALEAVPSIAASGGASPQRVHLVVPRSFNDAQQI